MKIQTAIEISSIIMPYISLMYGTIICSLGKRVKTGLFFILLGIVLSAGVIYVQASKNQTTSLSIWGTAVCVEDFVSKVFARI